MFDPRGPTFLELARQALSSTTKGYDLLAPKFEYTPFRTPDELLGPLAEEVGPDGSIERALDMGCGTGAAMAHLRRKCREEIVGVDLSEGMLKEARHLVEASPGSATVRLEQGDLLEMEFQEDFDVVTTVGAFGHILKDQQEHFARQVWDALRPGGRFLFVTAPMPPVVSRAYLISRLFNGAMHLRNALIKPEFIMFYLTFTQERAEEVLGARGFELEVKAPYEDTPFAMMRLVIARRPLEAK